MKSARRVAFNSAMTTTTAASVSSTGGVTGSSGVCLGRARALSLLWIGIPISNYGIFSESHASLAAETVTSGGTADAFQYQLLKQDLLSREASSVFTDSGSLSQEAIAGSREIIPASKIGNPEIPADFSKFSTGTYNSPSGPFQVHFYQNPTTGEIWTGLDYKTVLK